MTPPHVVVTDLEDGTGRRWCALCRLPEDNQIHQMPEVVDELSARILGEHEKEA